MAAITDLRLDAIGASIRDGVTSFCEKIMPALGDNLRSITVVGSSVTEDFKPGLSDINTVLLLGKQDLVSLNALASLVRSMGRKRISPPLLMTESYIERSRDVFGVEFLDFQLSHRTILGDDPFAALRFDKKDVRLQCERELKAMLIRLRQGYIASAANKKLVRDILISTAKGLEPILRAILWLKDTQRPSGAELTFSRAADELSIKMDSIITAGQWRYRKVRLSEAEMESSFETIYSTINRLADAVDKLEV